MCCGKVVEPFCSIHLDSCQEVEASLIAASKMPSMQILLSIGMLLTGALNTLSIKYQVRLTTNKYESYSRRPVFIRCTRHQNCTYRLKKAYPTLSFPLSLLASVLVLASEADPCIPIDHQLTTLLTGELRREPSSPASMQYIDIWILFLDLRSGLWRGGIPVPESMDAHHRLISTVAI